MTAINLPQDTKISELTIDQFTNLFFQLHKNLERAEDLPKHLSRKQAAGLLNVSMSTIDKWTKNGKIERVYVSGLPRFDRDVLKGQFNLN